MSSYCWEDTVFNKLTCPCVHVIGKSIPWHVPGYLNIFYETYPQSPGVEIQRVLFLVLFLLMTMKLIVVPFFTCFMYIVVLTNLLWNQKVNKQLRIRTTQVFMTWWRISRLLNEPYRWVAIIARFNMHTMWMQSVVVWNKHNTVHIIKKYNRLVCLFVVTTKKNKIRAALLKSMYQCRFLSSWWSWYQAPRPSHHDESSTGKKQICCTVKTEARAFLYISCGRHVNPTTTCVWWQTL